jgi:hypothetical protein
METHRIKNLLNETRVRTRRLSVFLADFDKASDLRELRDQVNRLDGVFASYEHDPASLTTADLDRLGISLASISSLSNHPKLRMRVARIGYTPKLLEKQSRMIAER